MTLNNAIVCLIGLLCIACSTEAQEDLAWGDAAIRSRCRFPLHASQSEGETVHCGTLHVPALRAERERGEFSLHFALFKATPPGKTDAVVEILGGPGQSWNEVSRRITTDFVNQRGQDLVVVEQRGATRSSPQLECENLESPDACLAELQSRGVVVEGINYVEMADDIADLTQALGFDQVNLLGTSYGTRIALEHVRRHPERTRSVVLDSAFPVEVQSDNEAGVDVFRTKQAIFEACARETSCAAAFPDLWKRLLALRLVLAEHPLRFEGLPFQLGFQDVWYFLDDVASYAPRYLPAIVNLVDTLATQYRGREVPAKMSEWFSKARQIFNIVRSDFASMFASCSDLQHVTVEAVDRSLATVPSEYQNLLLRSNFQDHANYCQQWPRAETDGTPVSNPDIPVLWLSGALDARTPMRWAESTLPHLRRSTLVSFSQLGHAVIGLDTSHCALQLANRFMQNPDEPLDTSCMSQVPQSFVIDQKELFEALEQTADQQQSSDN